MKKVLKTLGRILAGILILALVLVIALLVIPLTERVPAAPVSGAGDWMAALPDDRPISEIVVPGTHDSASMNAQLGFITKCQALSIAQQLNIGARYLDIRLGGADGTLKLVIDILSVFFTMDLHNVIGLCIGKNDENFVLATTALDQMVCQTDPESVTVAAVGNVFKDLSVCVLLVVIPKDPQDRIARHRAE